MADRTVSAIKAKVSLDSSDLAKAEGAAKQTGAAVKEHMTASTQHTLRFKESLTSLAEHVGKMPPIVGETARGLESMTANTAGMSALGIAGMGVGVALGVVAEGVHVAQESFLSAAEATHSYMRITQQSAEASSRQIEVFGYLGVSVDDAEKGMVKLEKAIATQPAHLAKLGIEIAKDTAGNTDMAATLGNVADAYNATADAAAKMNIVLTAFGKSGASMIPILEQGSAGLRKMEADAKLVMTDADIEQAHKYAIQQKQIDENWKVMSTDIGRMIQGPMSAASDEFLRQEFISKRLAETHQSLSKRYDILGLNSADLRSKFSDEYYAGEKAKEGIASMSEAMKAASETATAMAKAIDDATNATEASQNSEIHMERATLALSESFDKVDKAQDAVTQANAKFGKGSEEAKTAAFALSGTLLDQKQSYLDAAGAAQKLAEEQVGPDVDAAGKAAAGHAAYVKELEAERDGLAPGSALRVYLEAYIAKLNSIPADVNTNVTVAYQADRGAANRASGGSVIPNRTYTVGEEGPETLVMGAVGGTVIPHSGSSGSGKVTLAAGELDVLARLLQVIARNTAIAPSLSKAAYAR